MGGNDLSLVLLGVVVILLHLNLWITIARQERLERRVLALEIKLKRIHRDL